MSTHAEQMQSLNAFEKKERILTTYLLSNNQSVTNLTFTPPNSYSRYDGTFSLNNVPCLFEVKVRNFERTKYSSWILQLDKYQGLIKHINTHALLYINYFTTSTQDENESIVFNISKRYKAWGDNPPVERKYMNSATFRSTSYKVDKPVIMLTYDKDFGDNIITVRPPLKSNQPKLF